MAENEIKVPKRVLNTLINALEAGVVPRIGAPYIAIGRTEEIASLLNNLKTVEEGGAFCRFLIGRYGSGKSFLIQLIRGNALDENYLCMDADLSPERKLSGIGGIATYRELVRNMACKAMPDGGGLQVVLSRFYNQVVDESEKESLTIDSIIQSKIGQLKDLVGGFEFVKVLHLFLENLEQDEEVSSACLKWLRGEYITKTEARKELKYPIGHIIDDFNWYDYLKLWGEFSSIIGYKGLIVYIDECINLYKISNRISREANYEKLLSIFNDTLQGRAKNLGVIFGGTPQFLEDNRRGLFSYDALKSRLQDSRFLEMGYQNLSSPVIRLRRLSDNELLALIQRLSKLYSQKNELSNLLLDNQDTLHFLEYEMNRVGAKELVTPREIIRDFLTLLNILKDNPNAKISEILGNATLSEANLDDLDDIDKPKSSETTINNLYDFNL